MAGYRRRNARMVEGCCLFRIGQEEPLVLASRILRWSGVRIGEVDKKTNRIAGRIGSWGAPYSCKVRVSIHPHGTISLIDIVCKGSRRRPELHVLSGYLETLRSNFECALPVDVAGLMDWNMTKPSEKAAGRWASEKAAVPPEEEGDPALAGS